MELLSVGAWNKLPHYSLIGTPADFYVWINEGGRGRSSNWIKGANAFDTYNKLKKLYSKDRTGFINLIKQVMVENTKGGL